MEAKSSECLLYLAVLPQSLEFWFPWQEVSQQSTQEFARFFEIVEKTPKNSPIFKLFRLRWRCKLPHRNVKAITTDDIYHEHFITTSNLRLDVEEI